MKRDPLWYRDAIIYQVHVRAYKDSDGNGVGDFRGLTQQLDYVRDLGVTAIWLQPFYPSPLRDDGYDIADYTDVNPIYGTLGDFKLFLREAHRRDIRVITELVLNHTSDAHAWFQRARHAKPGSRERDFYVWSDTAEEFSEARVIFKDFEPSNWTWDPVAGAYYWHRFYAHQPDLNFRNPAVRRAMFEVLDFWLGMGVDGLRLDAVPYLYEEEGTTCENLPETHAFLRDLRRHVDANFHDRMLLAEANQWPEDAVAYFGDGDECHMAFHFPVMPRLFMALHMEDRFPVVDIMQQTPEPPDGGQWALFLRNHDELTLEMVTDEDRDYMYRAYAQDPRMRVNVGIRRRLAPLLGQRPPPHRTHERAAVLPAGHADHLLRRRDRDGGQHLSRRSQRRTHADAVEFRPERRLLARQPAAALFAGGDRPRIPLRGVERGGPTGQSPFRIVVDEAVDRAPQAARRLRPGHDRIPAARQPARARIPPAVRGADRARGGQPVALRAVRGTRAGGIQRAGPGGSVRAHARSRRSANCRTS